MKTVLILFFLVCLALSIDAKADKTRNHILIIGDSISLGYLPYVQKALPCVEHAGGNGNAGNNRDTKYILENLNKWLGTTRFSVIHFNSGIWDITHRLPHSKNRWSVDTSNTAPIAVSQNEYRENLEKIILRLEKTGAILIFATTTDVPDGTKGRISADVDTYNKIALDVASRHHVLIDDLHALMLENQNLHIDQDGNKVHYDDAGKKILGEKVTETLNRYSNCGS